MVSHYDAAPRAILLALVALALSACGRAKPSSAEFVDPVTGVSVRRSRGAKPTHPANKVMRTTLLAFAFFLCGCAGSGPPFRPAVGPPEFQNWCRQALAHPATGPEHHRFFDAYHGSSSAVSAYFEQAYRLERAPEMRSHTEEELQWTLETLAYRLGDTHFAAILRKERPQVQSAVTHFLQPTRLKGSFPQIQVLFDQTSKIDFPMEQAYRRDTAR